MGQYEHATGPSHRHRPGIDDGQDRGAALPHAEFATGLRVDGGRETGVAPIDPDIVVGLLQSLEATIDQAQTALDAAASAQARYLAVRICQGTASSAPPQPKSSARIARMSSAHIARMGAILSVTSGAGLLALLGWLWLASPDLMAEGAQTVRTHVIRFAESATGLTNTLAAVAPQLRPIAHDRVEDGDGKPAGKRVMPSRGAIMESGAALRTGSGASLPRTVRRLGGRAGTPIALRLALPEAVSVREVAVMIQGVPEALSISAGKRVAPETWILDGAQAADAALLSPMDFSGGTFALHVTQVARDGTVPEASLLRFTVQPSPPRGTPRTNASMAGSANTAALWPGTLIPGNAGSAARIRHRLGVPRPPLARAPGRPHAALSPVPSWTAHAGGTSAKAAPWASLAEPPQSNIRHVAADRTEDAPAPPALPDRLDEDKDPSASPDLAPPPPLPAASPAASQSPEHRMEPVTTHVNMRARPHNTGQVIAVVPAGRPVAVLACQRWCEVRFDGRRGWIHKRFIGEPSQAPDTGRAGDGVWDMLSAFWPGQ